MVIWIIKTLFVQFFCVFLPTLFSPSASVRSLPFLCFIVPIFAWHVPLVSLIFLKSSPVIPILFFSSLSLHWSLRKAFLSLLTSLWKSAFSRVCLSLSSLPFTSLLYSALCKASQITILTFCISFPLRWFWSLPTDNIMNFYPQFFRHWIKSYPLNLFVTLTV